MTECPLSDLPPSQCACPRHRGGTPPAEEPVRTVGPPFEAMFSGMCERGDRIREGDLIARVAAGGGYVHARGCPR